MTPEYTYIDSVSTFRSFADEIPQSFGFDTEFTREKTFLPIPELLQITTGERIAIFDLRANLPLKEIAPWFQRKDVERIGHSVLNDLEILREVFSLNIGPIDDTQLAFSFLNSGTALSYANLVAEKFEVALDKSMQRSRWDKRPLQRKQLDYAVMDIYHLPELWPWLKDELITAERYEWYIEERNRLHTPSADDPNNVVGNATKLLNLSEQGLQFVLALDRWLTSRAASLDIPKNWLLTRNGLFQLARERAINAKVLSNYMSDRQAQRHHWTLRKLQQKSRSQAQRSKQLSPSRLQETVRELGNRCKQIAAKLNVNDDLLVSNKDLLFAIRSYLTTGELPSWFGQWRIRLVGDITKQAAEQFAKTQRIVHS